MVAQGQETITLEGHRSITGRTTNTLCSSGLQSDQSPTCTALTQGGKPMLALGEDVDQRSPLVLFTAQIKGLFHGMFTTAAVTGL